MTDFASVGPNADSLCIQGDFGYAGIKDGNSVGWAIVNGTYLTDDQSVTMVLGGDMRTFVGAYNGAGTMCYTHCDSAHTLGAYCRAVNDQVTVGSYTRSGANYTYTPFTGGAHSAVLKWGDSVEFRNIGTIWYALVNDSELFNITDSSVTFGVDRRTAAISMERKSTAAFGLYPEGTYDSFRITRLVTADYVQPAFNGSGAKMKATGSNTHLSSPGDHILPAMFDVVERNTDDITADLASCKFTVQFAAQYKIVLRNKLNHLASAAGHQLSHLLYINGEVAEHGNVANSSYDGVSIFWPRGLQSTFSPYLAAGDYVQAGYNATGNLANIFMEEPTGLENYFSIALLPKTLI